MNKVLAAFVMASMIALAGCAEKTAPANNEDDDIFEEPTNVGSGKGLIRGIVIDSSITPVPEASVAVLNTALTATTDANGAFQFTGLEPGTYFLEVTKVGWTKIQATAQVEADVLKPEIIKVQIDKIPGTEPRAETFQDVGFIACGWGVPITYDYCGEYLGQEDDYRLQYMVAGTPDYIQVEIVWESNQPATDYLYMINALCPPQNQESCPGSIPAGKRWDEDTWASPAIMRTPAGFIDAAMSEFGTSDTDQWWVGVDVSADGIDGTYTGVTIDQEFKGYVTMFWNIEPAEDWTFVEDGAYQY